MSLQVGIPLFLLLALIQATVLPYLRIFGGQPDLIVIVVVAWSVLDHDVESMAWGLAGGLCLDFLSGAPLGLSALALVPLAFVVGLTEAQVYRANLFLPLVLAAGSALAYHLIYLILLRFLAGMPIAWSDALWYVTLPSVAFDVILFIPALRLLGRVYARLRPCQGNM